MEKSIKDITWWKSAATKADLICEELETNDDAEDQFVLVSLSSARVCVEVKEETKGGTPVLNYIGLPSICVACCRSCIDFSVFAPSLVSMCIRTLKTKLQWQVSNQSDCS